MPAPLPDTSSNQLKANICAWGAELGFGAVGFAGIDLAQEETGLAAWLARGWQGDMGYLERHGSLRTRPAELVPGTLSVISARLDYLPGDAAESWAQLEDPEGAFISRYALGRDYHKLMRTKLQALATRIEAATGPFGYRVFCDSAPVMEVALARLAGLGWRGKHTLLLSREAGSWYFLGEIYTDLQLEPGPLAGEHCGSCQKCLDICPTQAIVAPYQLDARRCISYLTIEHHGPIPEALRPLMGNRIYGCDDCQLVCPWNKFAHTTREPDFDPRHGLDQARLLELWAWSEDDFLTRFEGSAIRRIGYQRWLRNLAVALGNALASPKTGPAAKAAITDALRHKRTLGVDSLVAEHLDWALAQANADALPEN